MVVKSEAVGVWADGLDTVAVTPRFALLRVMPFTHATVRVLPGCCTGTVARRKDGSLDIIIRIRINAVSRLLGRESKKGPRTPILDTVVGLRILQGIGKLSLE